MMVSVRLYENSQPITFENVVSTYTKGPFYCLYFGKDAPVRKIPVMHIFDVQESY